MTEENIQEYKDKIAELEKQLEEAKKDKTDGSFDELKNKYEKIIEDKDKEIKELNKTVDLNNKKIDATVDDLNREVQERLEQTEAYKTMVDRIKQLEEEKAEVTAENVIRKGLALPVQKDTVKDWALKDPEGCDEYFKNAQPVVAVQEQKSKKINADITRLRDYFKN